jgi:hypothetical protein
MMRLSAVETAGLRRGGYRRRGKGLAEVGLCCEVEDGARFIAAQVDARSGEDATRLVVRWNGAHVAFVETKLVRSETQALVP